VLVVVLLFITTAAKAPACFATKQRRSLCDYYYAPKKKKTQQLAAAAAAAAIMERSSKLADLTLVSKYYPVANYSYPRNDHASRCSTRLSTGRSERTSLGSEGSAPGLIDDRTDSEVSVDDDYQWHANMSELWDSFWPRDAATKPMEEATIHPKKQYPALIPSPRNRRRRQPSPNSRCPAWPLPDGSPRERSRKPAATYTASPKPKPAITYSPFPKPPKPTPASQRISRQASILKPTSRPVLRPVRPPRPDDELLIDCVQPPASAPAIITTCAVPNRHSRQEAPLSPTMDWSPVVQRQTRSLDEGTNRPMTANAGVYSSNAHSATHLPLSPCQAPKSRAPRHFKSMAQLVAKPLPPLPATTRPAEPEPHSVFEDDSSDDDGERENRRSFFRFHKRSDSDQRHTSKAPASSQVTPARRRARALTAPSSPTRQQPDRLCKQETPGRKKQGPEVFGRMLGRRSR